MKDENLENLVVYMHGQGKPQRHIARELGIGRQRVKRVLRLNTQNREKKGAVAKVPKPKRPSKLDPFKTCITELLGTYTDPPITKQRVYELIVEKGYTGKMTILHGYLAQLCGKKEKEPVYCVETPAGQRASHDWSDYTINFTAGGGSHRQVTFLSYILNYSRRQYIEAVPDKTQVTLLRCLVNAFIYFDGVPREIKSDNQKACVDRWETGHPVFNKTYLAFASHYRFRPLAIRPGKPRENLKVERPFYYLETNFLNGRKFYDTEDLKKQLRQWLQQRNDLRRHATTGRRPLDMYLEELPHLQALPKEHFDTAETGIRVVNNESAVQWKNYYYMVPGAYINQTCTVRQEGALLLVYSPNGQEIARHPLAGPCRKDRYVGRGHKPAGQRSTDIQEVRERLWELGPVVQQYMGLVKNAKPATFRHHWRHLLRLKACYHAHDIVLAVERALNYNVFEAQAIENFLKINAQPKTGI